MGTRQVSLSHRLLNEDARDDGSCIVTPVSKRPVYPSVLAVAVTVYERKPARSEGIGIHTYARFLRAQMLFPTATASFACTHARPPFAVDTLRPAVRLHSVHVLQFYLQMVRSHGHAWQLQRSREHPDRGL